MRQFDFDSMSLFCSCLSHYECSCEDVEVDFPMRNGTGVRQNKSVKVITDQNMVSPFFQRSR